MKNTVICTWAALAALTGGTYAANGTETPTDVQPTVSDAAQPVVVAESGAALPAPSLEYSAEAAASAQKANERRWEVWADYVTNQEADFDDTDGDIKISRWGTGVSYKMPIEDNQTLKLRFRYEQSDYNGDDLGGGGTSGSSGNDQFDQVSETTLGATYVMTVNPDWLWFGMANVTAGVDNDADWSDGYYFDGGGGFAYTVNEKLKLGLGVNVYTRIEEDADVFPYPVIEYEINERSRIGFVKSTDPSIGYTYELDASWDLYASMWRGDRQYAIDDDVINRAAFIDQEYGLKIGALYNHPDGFGAEVYVGGVVRNLEVDVDDHKLDDEDVDAAVALGVAVSYSF